MCPTPNENGQTNVSTLNALRYGVEGRSTYGRVAKNSGTRYRIHAGPDRTITYFAAGRRTRRRRRRQWQRCDLSDCVSRSKRDVVNETLRPRLSFRWFFVAYDDDGITALYAATTLPKNKNQQTKIQSFLFFPKLVWVRSSFANVVSFGYTEKKKRWYFGRSIISID